MFASFQLLPIAKLFAIVLLGSVPQSCQRSNRKNKGNTFLDDVPNPIDNDGVEIPPSSHDEVKVAIMRFKNNKAAGPDGLSAELLKIGVMSW